MATATPTSDFQLACFRAANTRLLFRVKRRENWLALQLLLQTILVALALVSSVDLLSEVLIASLPLSFVLACLYVAEDRLVGHIVAYLDTLAQDRAEPGKPAWMNLEASPAGRDYVHTTLPVRLIAQFFGFILFPLSIAAYRLLSIPDWGSRHTVEMIVAVGLSVVIAWMLLDSYQMRRQPTG